MTLVTLAGKVWATPASEHGTNWDQTLPPHCGLPVFYQVKALRFDFESQRDVQIWFMTQREESNVNIQIRGIKFRIIELEESSGGYQVRGRLRPPWGWRRRSDVDPMSRLLAQHFTRRIGRPVDVRIDARWDGKFVEFAFFASVPTCCAASLR